MGDALTVKIVGGARLKRQLQALERAVQREILENATVAGGLLVANRWKELARFLTGTYRRSIHVGGHTDLTPDFGQGPGEGGVEFHDIGRGEVEDDYAEAIVGTDVPYGPRLEYGFTGRDSLGRYYNQPGDGAGRQAFDETRDDVVKEIGEALEDQLVAAARKTR